MKKGWLRSFCVLAGMTVLSTGIMARPLADGKIDIDRTVNSPTITVRYTGLKAALVELRLNGKSVSSRALDKSSANGETNFAIDLRELSDGDNVLEVCFFDAGGKLVGTQKTTVTADRDAGGPVFIAGPKAGATLMGPIEIKIGLNRDFREMYVSFFVDDDWKSLKNYPPYSYLWDTTQSTNGWHDIQAWVVDETNNTFKTRKVRVFVNNPGGRTDRMSPEEVAPKTEPKVAPKAPVEPTKRPKTIDLQPAKNTVKAAIANPGANGKPPIGSGVVVEKSARPDAKAPKLPVVPKPLEKPVVALAPSSNSIEGPIGVDSGMKSTLGKNGVATNPKIQATPPSSDRTLAEPTVSGIVGPNAGMKPAKIVGGVTTGPKAMTPTGSRTAEADSKPVAPKPLVANHSVPKANVGSLSAMQAAVSQLQTVRIAKGAKLPNVGTFTVLVNSQIVNFDVPPRVVKGVPLTPFRHLFENAGGQVKWESLSKTVVANGLGKEITIHIGKATAMVDGKPMGMEIAASIDQGRTIVPLSFIKESLNVDVEYDPNTGHVLITTHRS